MSPTCARCLEWLVMVFVIAGILFLISGAAGINAAVEDLGSRFSTLYGLTLWVTSAVFAKLIDTARHRKMG